MSISRNIKVCVACSFLPRLCQQVRNLLPTETSINEIVITDKGVKELNNQQLALLKDAEVLLADPDFLIKSNMLYSVPKLQWFQSVWAGVDGLIQAADESKPFPEFMVTRFAGVLGQQMSEYVIGHIIAHERHFFGIKNDQRDKVWNTKRQSYRLLSQLTIGILGAGDIGRDVARACKHFGMSVWGVARTIPPINPFPDIDQYRSSDDVKEMFENCDYICNLLPSTNLTKGFLDGDILKHCSTKKAVFINIGRGSVISEETLIKALEEKWLSHLILDVFNREPLPKNSQLWSHPSVTITPHASGVTDSYQVAEVFADNYKRYCRGDPLKYTVQWEAGY